jgi:uncharacterized protein YjbI with pentapeptide repeats
MSGTKKIGNKIAEARKKANISQAQLADRLFISPQAVGKWERGESMPDIITFNRIAEMLGVDLNYFSDNFQSATTVKLIDETLAKQLPDRQTETQILPVAPAGKKISWDMSLGNWVDADFSGLKNLNEKFGSSNMQRCKFIGSDLPGLILKSNNIDSCDFSGSDISNSRIENSHLNKNSFRDCSLKETVFTRTHINACDFAGANFTGTTFSESYIFGCDLSGVDFTGVVIKSGGLSGVVVKTGEAGKNTIANVVWNRTSFVDAQITDLVFVGTLEDCYFENCAFTRVTFQNATLINTFFKNNKKLKQIRFIDCKADRITYEFLKQGKADLSGIEMVV